MCREFALGSHSFNPIFGVTRNAYDPSRSAGGSSGGSAVALALRMMPLADGSDFGGSLRNPAAWNNVFGFRPSFGRVPSAPSVDVFGQTFATSGPMARTVRDTALLLSVQAGSDPRAPFSLQEDPAVFAKSLDREWKGKRIGWLGDLGGALPMEPGVLETCEKALEAFRAFGMSVDAATLAEPADTMWRTAVTLRHWSVGADLLPLADKPEHARDDEAGKRSGKWRAIASSALVTSPRRRWAAPEFTKPSARRSRDSISSRCRARRFSCSIPICAGRRRSRAGPWTAITAGWK